MCFEDTILEVAKIEDKVPAEINFDDLDISSFISQKLATAQVEEEDKEAKISKSQPFALQAMKTRIHSMAILLLLFEAEEESSETAQRAEAQERRGRHAGQDGGMHRGSA